MTIQIKATEQYFPVVLFIVLYKVVVILSLLIKLLSVAIQTEARYLFFIVVMIAFQYYAQ